MVSVWPVNCLGSALRLGPAVQGGVQQAVALLQALYHLGRHSWALVFSDSLKLLQLIGQVERGQDRQPADVRRPTLPPQRAPLGVQRGRQLADVVGVDVGADAVGLSVDFDANVLDHDSAFVKAKSTDRPTASA